MRLSQAFMLGIVTCKLVPRDINSCAFGVALNSMGVPNISEMPKECLTTSDFLELKCHSGYFLELKCRWGWVKYLWPWTAPSANESGMWVSKLAGTIFEKFDYQVCTGNMTPEQLHDYIKSIEPDCDCNRFNCDCAARATSEEFVEMSTESTAHRLT